MNTFGQYFKVTTFGESHGVALGTVIDGCPAGLQLNLKDIQIELNRRKPGQSKITTPRKEGDIAEILSGVFEEKTIGTPIAVIVRNKDQNSKDYSQMQNIFRPGHADETWHEKYHYRDHRGGGRQSGRETLSRVIAGAVAKKLLYYTSKTKIIGSVFSLGEIKSENYNEEEIENNIIRCADKNAAKKMEELIIATMKKQDSLGAEINIKIKNPPKYLGSPVFEKLEANLAKAILSVGTTRSFEYGEGIKVASKLGSEQNKINEGISGGISNGEEININIAIKPTPTISQIQKMKTAGNKIIDFSVKGRHDPVIAPRFVPVAESMVAIVLADMLLAPPDRVDQIFRK